MSDRVSWLESPVLRGIVSFDVGVIALWGDHVPLLVHHEFSYVSGLRLAECLLFLEQTKVVSDC